MSNIDFISEKWRTCRRTRNLAYIHVASSIFPIIYVAVYAEAQRRDGDDKELGAALAALMFNVFQLMRTIMGILQLNAFVAWYKDAVLCVRALLGKDRERSDQDVDSNGLSQFETILAWCKGWVERMSEFVRRWSGNKEQTSSPNNDESKTNIPMLFVYGDVVEEDIEEVIEVNNSVVDNELGGREVTVLPSWQKMWDGLKKGSFKPSKWLYTDRVMLSTVRWSGAFLCGMNGFESNAEMLEKFFSRDMWGVRRILQCVDWNIGVENGSPEILSICEVGDKNAEIELTGEMSTAFGTGLHSYYLEETDLVKSYSFEFNDLVSSYPFREKKYFVQNREKVTVELVHSLILAKHLGVEKLRAISQYYDHYWVPLGPVRGNAFRLLGKQTNCRIPDDDNIWMMFGSYSDEIPLFPYRMQAVALWDKATNWRVLQASAHHDVRRSLSRHSKEKQLLDDGLYEVDIFDTCAKRTAKHIASKGILGVVMETVRTFLAEWIVASAQEPVWEPEVPDDCFEFDLVETSIVFGSERRNLERLIWVCQRELQRKVAQSWSKNENLPGNATLIMLFMLGFPFLRMENEQDTEICAQGTRKEIREENGVSSQNRDHSVDVNVQVLRVRAALAPQDISLMIRLDLTKHTVTLSLQNNSVNGRFIWQDWVDAAMGYMKGAEERAGGKRGYGRKIVRADLRKPMVELCPLRLDKGGIEAVVKETKTAVVWLGWPVFDLNMCKFEIEQWLAACNVDLRRGLARLDLLGYPNELKRAEQEIGRIVSAENEDVKSWTHDNEV